ncbi:MAG: adenylate/guanylate cyclase domain-containing protein [Chloroflexi bacterium]|nr:MAG: adenylate/guanylate cyclase domain-containing protein [Chloroflexota bacterium]
MERLVALFGTVGAKAGETDDERLRRALLVVLACLISVLAVGWGLLYIAFGESLGGAIPLAYTVLSLASIVVLTLTRRYDVFRFTQLSLMLVLPFALMVALGGFIPSSVVAAWAFFAPLGALAFASTREARRWFAGYVVLLVATGVLGGALRSANNLPAGLVGAMFVVNITGVSVVVFATLFAFVRERDKALDAVQRLFGQYLSPQIARTLLTDPRRSALGGENREVSALFADLEGFTPFTESRPPQETVNALNRYFSAVVPVIFANGGTIIQFAGDAIVAVWNAPVEQPRHALAAARTALAMQRAIEEIVRADPTLPRFRVGIATGAALVGNIGSEELRNFVAHGDAVNLAARLQTGAKAGQVVISAPTFALIRDVASVRPLGRFNVKGKSEEVEAFVLEGIADRSGLQP